MTEQNVLPEEQKPKTKGFYNKYDLVSFLIKSIRLRRREDALSAMHLLLREGVGQYYIAKKLVQLASEDATSAEAFIYAQSVFQFIVAVKDEMNSLSRLVLYLCDCEMQWESEKESEWEVRRLHLEARLRSCYERGKKPLELPSYVFDRYTSRGKAAMNRGEQIDRRVSGVLESTGLLCRAVYLKHGDIDPEHTTIAQAYSPHLLQCVEEKLHVDAYIRRHGITVDDFLKP